MGVRDDYKKIQGHLPTFLLLIFFILFFFFSFFEKMRWLTIGNMNPKTQTFKNNANYCGIWSKNPHLLKVEVGFSSDEKVFRKMAKWGKFSYFGHYMIQIKSNFRNLPHSHPSPLRHQKLALRPGPPELNTRAVHRKRQKKIK